MASRARISICLPRSGIIHTYTRRIGIFSFSLHENVDHPKTRLHMFRSCFHSVRGTVEKQKCPRKSKAYDFFWFFTHFNNCVSNVFCKKVFLFIKNNPCTQGVFSYIKRVGKQTVSDVRQDCSLTMLNDSNTR